jgi:hypothetical protein
VAEVNEVAGGEGSAEVVVADGGRSGAIGAQGERVGHALVAQLGRFGVAEVRGGEHEPIDPAADE